MKKIAIGEVTCNICGETYYYEGRFNEQVAKDKNKISASTHWMHEFDLKNIGYGSFLDMSPCQIHICDNCLEETFKKMKIKPIIGGDGLHTYDRRIDMIEEITGKDIKNLSYEKIMELREELKE